MGKLSGPVPYYSIFLLYSKNFIHDCRFENLFLWWNEKPTTAFWLYYDKLVLQI